MSDDTPAALGALQIDEGKLRGHVDEVSDQVSSRR
jgi:hypothetical protein